MNINHDFAAADDGAVEYFIVDLGPIARAVTETRATVDAIYSNLAGGILAGSADSLEVGRRVRPRSTSSGTR